MSVSALFTILVSFYQLKSVLAVEGNETETGLIENVFNLDFIVSGRNEFNVLCASSSLTAVWKELLKGYFSTIAVLSLIFFAFIVAKFVDRLSPIKSSSKTEDDLKVGLYVLLSFSYKNIAKTALSLIHCRYTLSENLWFLYIDGSIVCYNTFQKVNMAFILLWVIPFPFAVALGYNLLRHRKIPLWIFMLGLIIPFAVFFVFLRSVFFASINEKVRTYKNHHTNVRTNKNIRNRFKEIFEEPYKTFFIWWESWRLLERLTITALNIFIINPLLRTIYLAPVLIFFLYFNLWMDPFKKSMNVVRKFDMVSYFCLCIHLVINSMRSVSYIYSLCDDELMMSIEKILGYTQEAFSPLWYLIVSFVGNKIYAKIRDRKSKAKVE